MKTSRSDTELLNFLREQPYVQLSGPNAEGDWELDVGEIFIKADIRQAINAAMDVNR